MGWQQQMVREISARLPAGAVVEVVGSTTDAPTLDGWSDLDLHLRLPQDVEFVDLLRQPVLWAAEVTEAAEGQVVRAVLADGRRVDLLVETGRLLLPSLAPDNDVRFLAALAASKLGRHDRLIGMHLLLELLQACLLQAMLLRDRDEGTRIHRTGQPRDRLADDVAGIAQLPLDVATRPNVVERTVDLYGQWRCQLEPGYEPDWSGLTAVVTRGLEKP
jgi:hypothetical protein